MKNFVGRLMVGVGVASIAAQCGAEAPAADPVASRFGVLESVREPSLSPDGNKLAYIVPYDDATVLYIVDLSVGGAPKAITRLLRENGTLSSCLWSTETRLICRVAFVDSLRGPLLTYTRSFALNSDGSGLIQLSSRVSKRALGVAQDGGTVIDWDLEGEPGKVLMTRDFVPESTLNTRLASTEEGLGVEIVDVRTGGGGPWKRASVKQATI